jgi:hypothetical protein
MGGTLLLEAAIVALQWVAWEFTRPEKFPDTFDPPEIVAAFEEAVWRFDAKEVRNLGDAFGLPQHEGRLVGPGPTRAVRGSTTMIRRDAIFYDCIERFRDRSRDRHARTRAVVFSEVGTIWDVGPELIAKLFNAKRQQIRLLWGGADPLPQLLEHGYSNQFIHDECVRRLWPETG